MSLRTASVLAAVCCAAGVDGARGAEAALHFSHAALPFVLENSESPQRYAPETMAGGVAVFDYDNDGDLDLFFVNGAELPRARKSSDRYSNRLLRNDGSGEFTDVTAEAGLRGEGYGFGAAVADYDNDGDQDLFVAGLHRNQLFHNRGDGRFEEVSTSAGIGADDSDFGPLWAVAGAWADYDNDGWLDLFVVNYLAWTPGVDPVCDGSGVRDYCHPKHYKGTPNRLYRNRGDGTFEDVSARAGIRAKVGKGMGAAVADFDLDGFVDIFVTNDKLPNFLFRNRNGEAFEEIAFESTAALPEHGRDVSGMGLDARDVNDDGRPDIVYTALPDETFPLFINSPDGFFEDRTRASGLATATRRMAGYSALIADFDNDGLKDVFFSCGDVQSHPIDPSLPVDQHNAVFRNLGAGKFQSLAPEASGLDGSPKRRHRGAAVGDLNGDGKLDVVVSALGSPAELWINDSGADSHWLAIRLVGKESNRDGMGALIRVETADGTQHNHATSSVGYASSSAGPVHFGLGGEEIVKRITVRWPSGTVQAVEDVRADQTLLIEEPD